MNTSFGILRFITAGSVDDGKSTLIGRLLYDSKAVLSDQLSAISKAKNRRTSGQEIDFSLLTDGLEAEREQGITIDVAYRYFSTAKRKFIIADAPGHAQYTRNMVTGASTADAAIILIDAAKFLKNQSSLLEQTKRHSVILKKLDVHHIIVAVNKMDQLCFSEEFFKEVVSSYETLASLLGLSSLHILPISALHGDNVVHRSENTPWYSGPTLLNLLESLPVESKFHSIAGTYFPVQCVIRRDGASVDSFRGYSGRIESGSLEVGQKILAMPINKEATVSEILTTDGPAQYASAGQNITVCVEEDVDISRGCIFVSESSRFSNSYRIQADLCWFACAPLNLNQKYLIKHTTNWITCKVESVDHVLDVNTLQQVFVSETLDTNDIGRVSIRLQQPLGCDIYSRDIQALGSFILVDPVTNHTVASGMIRAF